MLASIDCDQFVDSTTFVSDGHLYAICGDDVIEVDLESAKLVRRYPHVFAGMSIPSDWSDSDQIPADGRSLIVDGSLWIDDWYAGKTWRVDLRTGEVVDTYKDALVGDWGGYVWLRSVKKPTVSSSYGPDIVAVDPSTGRLANRTLPFKTDPTYACGSLWTWNVGQLDRFDLAGKRTWSTTSLALAPSLPVDPSAEVSVPWIEDVFDAAGQCWVELKATTALGTGPQMLVRLDGTCVAERSPVFDDTGYRTVVGLLHLGDALWVWVDTDAGYGDEGSFRRLDPSKWQQVGPAWSLADLPIASGSFLWMRTSDGGFAEIDIPVDPLPYTPPTPLPCGSASPSPTAG